MSGINLYHRITTRDDNSINLYFRDVSKYPLLTPEEEKETAKKAREGDQKAIDKLITSNLRFVITVAKQYQGKGLSLGDLIQFGNQGLINSISKFDPDKGFRFMSYSIWWVRQAIVKALSDNSRTIRIPYTKASGLHKIMVAKGQFEQTNGREPTLEELSGILNMSLKELKDTLEAPKSMAALENPFTSDEDAGSLLDVTPNKNTKPTDYKVDEEDTNRMLHLVIDKLDNRTYDILMMFFGINGVETMTLKEIGIRFGIGEERVRQIKNKALKQLKERYSKYYG